MKTSIFRLTWMQVALTLIGAGTVAADAHRRFQIHPSIGIARVGDSTTGSYLAPDVWETDFVPTGGYRDSSGRIKRMGVRFRIYEVDAQGTVVGEITTSATTKITWQVHLANKKAAKDGLNLGDPADLVIDTGPQVLRPRDRQLEVGGTIGPADTYVKLGNLETDADGRLTVLGGHGEAASWSGAPLSSHDVHNRGWYDDTSDGPVDATITVATGDGGVETFEARSAWVVVAPPDYAHPVVNLVTLYDLVRDRSVPFEPYTLANDETPEPASFRDDVYPILGRVPRLQWTLMEQRATQFGRTAMHAHGIEGSILSQLLQGAHDMHRTKADFFEPAVFSLLHLNDPTDPLFPAAQVVRNHVLDRLKDPRSGGCSSGDIGEPHSMPPIEGLTLTPTQYDALLRWRDGLFDDFWDPTWDPADPAAFEPAFPSDAVDEPAALDRAALNGAAGGPLTPGVEVGPLMADADIYDAPFHIDSDEVEPGDVTRDLSVPWQAGFNQQAQLYPGARPVYVIVKSSRRDYAAELWTRPHTTLVPITRPGFSTDDTAMDTTEILMDYDTIYQNQRMDHNQDMVDHWNELGFLTRDTTVTDEVIYIETSRSPGN